MGRNSTLFAAALVATAASPLAQADALTIELNPISSGTRFCYPDTGACTPLPSATGFLIVGGRQELGNTEARAAFEYAFSDLPSAAIVSSVLLQIGALSRYGPTGPQDSRIGTIVLSAYDGNGALDDGDFFNGFPTVTLQRAAVSLYDVTADFNTLRNLNLGHIGFSARQTPIGVCGTAPFCENVLTGSSLPPTGTTPIVLPKLFVEYTLPPVDPPPGVVPEPASWALMIAGFGLIGGAVRRRDRRGAVEVRRADHAV